MRNYIIKEKDFRTVKLNSYPFILQTRYSLDQKITATYQYHPTSQGQIHILFGF